jgi:hypothetical protein
MFDKPYPFQPLGKRETFIAEPTQRTHYRFKASYRTYFVTLEIFSYGVAAIKYCDVKDKDSKNAYKKIFNDGDAFRVITTCLYIMLDYWKKNPNTSFAFYSVPRELQNTLLIEDIKNLEVYKKVRFRIYKYAMINLFSPTYFTQLTDEKNCIYLLLNKNQQNQKLTLTKMGEYLLNNYSLIFEVD